MWTLQELQRRIEEGREVVEGFPSQLSQTGEAYLTFKAIAKSEEEVLHLTWLLAQEYLTGRTGKLYWRRTPDIDHVVFYPRGSKEQDGSELELWSSYCRFLVSGAPVVEVAA